jgi:hypothetical protein
MIQNNAKRDVLTHNFINKLLWGFLSKEFDYFRRFLTVYISSFTYAPTCCQDRKWAYLGGINHRVLQWMGWRVPEGQPVLGWIQRVAG